MEDFNLKYAQHPSLDLLKNFLLKHGAFKIIKKKEIFSIQGKKNLKGAYIKSGAFRYFDLRLPSLLFQDTFLPPVPPQRRGL